MDPTEFIIGLMRENTDALGFIPRSTIIKQFVTKDRYILQVTRHGRTIGYLLHGPVHPDGHMNVAQACIQLDKRSRGFGSAVVARLLCRARAARANVIYLRCALDLQACLFWRTEGFTPIDILPGGRRRRRTIIRFRYDLAIAGVQAGYLPETPRSNPIQMFSPDVPAGSAGSQQRKTEGNSHHLPPPYTLNSQ